MADVGALTPYPRRSITEAALVLIREITLESDSRTSARKPGRIRTSYNYLGTLEPDVLQAEAAIFRYVSIVESYIDTLSLNLLGEALPYLDPIVKILVDEYELQSTSNWDRRHDKYNKIHTIHLKGCTDWNKVNAAIEARNTIAHGLGRLTPLQQKKSNISSMFAPIGVSVNAGRIRLSLATAGIVRDACIAFMGSVDQKCPPG